MKLIASLLCAYYFLVCLIFLDSLFFFFFFFANPLTTIIASIISFFKPVLLEFELHYTIGHVLIGFSRLRSNLTA